MAFNKFMQTFFEGVQDQTFSGYGSKIVSTPMGPFAWNDTLNMWINTNNGMAMNNISFQDSIAMLDYSTYDGGGDSTNQIVFGTIPMIFSPSVYSITSNYLEGSSVTITPSIVVPASQPNFDIKFITDGGYIGGTLSSINISRNRNGSIVDVAAVAENSAWPPLPGLNNQPGDIFTFEVQANSRQSIGTEGYTFYWYDQSGGTLSGAIRINVNIPGNPFIYWNANEVWEPITGLTLANSISPANSRFGGMNVPVFITITEIKDSPSLTGVQSILYSIPETSGATTYVGGFTWGLNVLPGGNFGIQIKTPVGSGISGSGVLRIVNVTDSNRILADVPYSFDIP